jgi:hypothetical protein
MAGLGKKTWNALDVLTAADVNGYLMDQAVMKFASAAARTSAVATASAGMLSFRADGTAWEGYNGSTWGSIVDTASIIATSSTAVATLTNKTLTSPVLNGAALEAAYTTATGFAGYTFDVTTNGAVQYSTASATANGTVNFRSTSGVSLNTLMSTNQSITVVLAVTNGATAYYPTAYQIDGTSVTPKWSGGTAPTGGNASAIDIYTFTIIKTASATFTVLASQTKFA